MNIDEVKKNIIEKYGSDSFNKGMRYSTYYVSYLTSFLTHDGIRHHIINVESEHTYSIYQVHIYINRANKIVLDNCGCEQYRKCKTCKHIVASILRYHDILFPEPVNPLKVTNEILKVFYNTKNDNKNIKERVNLEVELDFSSLKINFRLLIGLNKKYLIKTTTQFEDFMNVYLNGGIYEFGAKFTYDSSKHFLNDEDDWFLRFLYNYEGRTNYYSRSNTFELTNREGNILLEKLKNKEFKIRDYGYVNGVINDFPTNLDLIYEDGEYKIIFADLDKITIPNNNIRYMIFNKMLYIIPETYFIILDKMYENNISYLSFKKDDLDMFKNGLLKKIKNNVKVADNVNDIVISGKPDSLLYFDFLRNKIKCNIKLKYGDRTINYFDKETNILRDEDAENEVITDLFNNKFTIDQNNITLTEIDDIGEFLNNGITNLKEKYDIYTTMKFDELKIKNKSSIQSNFSIGRDGILSYNFIVDNINIDELDNVFTSLRNNKKYYKLKNGDILKLQGNDELEELSSLVNELELNKNDIESGNITIPKYRAFYIDSLKNNKFKTINTNSSFDNFINNFEKYKNIDIELSKEDKKILRDYQIDGIKWLYTLYKCDLGGILADEMGLGKTIQTIYLIKQILKEKPDSKILIVCPTALVYNWKKEFDMFGSELKYITVADNKIKRKEVLSNFDKYNIFITTYGLIRNDNDEYEDKDFELCVIDEAQNIKNYQAEMSKEVKKIKSHTKIALTGTPLENSVLELWSIFDFILPGYLNSILKFKSKYGINDIDEESLSKLDMLNYQIKPFILRRKKQDVVKDLPDKIENNIYLELPEMQKKLYLKELTETRKEFEEMLKTDGFFKARFKILTLLMKLRQICVDPTVMYENYKYESIKLEKLTEMVKNYVADGHKILIFSSFKRIIEHVREIFDKENISNYLIDGDIKSKERMELVEKFNNDNTNTFLITLKSGGVGLNLTGADIVIHLDIWWNPQVENQATDRAHRIGQKNTVIVNRLITKGTIEERILELQNKKKTLSDNLIEGKNDSKILETLSEKEMKELLSYGDDENE